MAFLDPKILKKFYYKIIYEYGEEYEFFQIFWKKLD